MKFNRPIQKFFAIVLLLLFAQKIGVELYLHNWLHTNNSKQFHSQVPVQNVVSYSCNCIDDFSMPFAEPASEILTSAIVYQPIFFSPDIQSDSFTAFLFHSLRAPPAINS
jgi:hypothetical protein